jgi:hypothetical protein
VISLSGVSVQYVHRTANVTVNLRLPDCVAHSPEPCHDEEDVFFVRIRIPKKHPNDQTRVDGSSKQKDGDSRSDYLSRISQVKSGLAI